MALTKSSIILVFLCYTQQVFLDDSDGYYWRDYNRGVVPKDALPGGTNVNGKTTYIGQALHDTRNFLTPAKIDPEVDLVVYEYGLTEHRSYKYVKILCTKHPEQFEWISTEDGQFDKINRATLVRGGCENNADLFIGRRQIASELALGKVVPDKTGHNIFYAPVNGTGLRYSEYQVLSHNPNKKINHLQSTDTNTTMNGSSCTIKQRIIVINFYA